MKSIAFKINFLIIGMLILIIGLLGGYLLWQQRNTTYDEFKRNSQQLSLLLAHHLTAELRGSNKINLEKYIQTLQVGQDIAYILVCNNAHTIAVEKNYFSLANIPPQTCDNTSKGIATTSFVENETKQEYINVLVPIIALTQTNAIAANTDTTGLDAPLMTTKNLGYLQVGFSLKRIEQTNGTFLWRNLLTLLITFSSAVLFVLWQTKRFISPIKRLVTATHTMMEGGLGIQCDTLTDDEIGELTLVFNKISIDLLDAQQNAQKRQSTLEFQVNERIRELQHQLDKSSLLAEKSSSLSKAKSEFLTVMSHEIRTPMSGVLGMVELLLNTELSDRQMRLASGAYRSAETLLSVINNILDFSEVEAGTLRVSIQDFDIRGLLEDVGELMFTQAQYKGLELILHLPVDLNGMLRGDAERLRQVLVNLLDNAIKTTQVGEVQLRVSSMPANDGTFNITLLFEVLDTGPGLAHEQQQVIFESFTLTENAVTHKFDPTGLGLILSRQLLQLMSGSLGLESHVGQGTRFYFSLDFEQSKQLTIHNSDIGKLQAANFLVVDDNTSCRELLQDQLKHWGINTHCFANGAEAFAFLQSSANNNIKFQLGIVDWQMPEMNGWTFAQHIANDKNLAYLPLIMLCSEHISPEVIKAKANSIHGFLSKPIVQRKLLYSLLEVLEGDKVTDLRLIASEQALSKFNALVLVAEDNLINQEVGVGILNELGCQTEVVQNGIEALESIRQKNYDLVLMDCHMPEMDGFVATRAIRQFEQSSTKKSLPIIALTADIQPGIVEQCMSAGMDDYLSKPFNIRQLHAILLKWLAPHIEGKQVFGGVVVANDFSGVVNENRSLINLEALRAIQNLTTDAGENVLVCAINLFQKVAPEDLIKMRNAVKHQKTLLLAKIAHSFKSAAGNLGAFGLVKVVAAIEVIANQGTLVGIDEHLLALEAELPQVLNILRAQADLYIDSVADDALHKPSNEWSNKSILLVDDDDNYRLITHSVLSASAFEVLEASNGLKALGMVKQYHPDLIILDAVMEGIDGFEVCRILRQDPNTQDIPVIMSTGLGDIDSINKAFDVGATDFIVKPLNYPILIHRIGFILRASQNTSELKKSKFQLSAAQRIARLGYWTWDAESDRFQMSEHLASLCMLDLNDFGNTLESFIQMIHPEDRGFVRDTIVSVGYTDSIQHTEYRLQITSSILIVVHQELEVITENDRLVVTGTVQDITHKKQAEKQIQRLAYYDNLTGLASRAYYHERIEAIIKMAEQHDERFAFLFLDMDGFKAINDSFGHDVGDQFLQAISLRLQSEIRDIDFVARLGGDEFCIIVNNMGSYEGVAEFATRILVKINIPLVIGQNQIKPKVSIGIAIFPDDGINEIELMKAADSAMYAAKQAGKQCYMFYSGEMASQAINRLHKEQQLKEAFKQNQFVLYYQPQISMHTGRMVAMEALIRWQHPEFGIILPGEFLPYIDQFGMTVELGNWVISTACEQLAKWHRAGMPYQRVAVNIEASHFQHPQLLEYVAQVLARTGIQPKYLELEVTESAMQSEGHLEVFNKFRALGVRTGIDDFGTGFSCLALLKQLPLDSLKIDKFFVDDVLSNQHTALFLGTIIGLSQALEYNLVAEGVESRDQALVIYGLGCYVVQGYFFSKPVPAHKIPELIKRDFSIQSKDFSFSSSKDALIRPNIPQNTWD